MDLEKKVFELLRNIHGNGESKLHDYILTINKQKKKDSSMKFKITKKINEN